MKSPLSATAGRLRRFPGCDPRRRHPAGTSFAVRPARWRTRRAGLRSRPIRAPCQLPCSAAPVTNRRIPQRHPAGKEKRRLANWSHFRPAHNKSEGNEDVRLIASSNNLTFRSGPGSCVIDDYTTSNARYREIACLVDGPDLERRDRRRCPHCALGSASRHVGARRVERRAVTGAAPNTAVRDPIIEPRNPHDCH